MQTKVKSRLVDIPEEDRTPEQRAALAEAASGLRGRVPAPMRAWIASPELARRAQALGEFLRYQTALGPRLSELAILVTARLWTSQYEWFVHARAAREAGLEEETIESIRHGRRPVFPDATTRVVHDAALAIHRERGLADEAYAEARDILGERGLAELVGLLGYYTLVSMTLNVYRIGVPDGVENPLPTLMEEGAP
ncbi:carboxymuconolactone decarboxylase family protein [Roseomonas sp. CCTCC AB2023176]|uniref:carboxymuconolactone decarboxylase family protein n=1 Tax=Roseomonas sp. CCTCC AB2023176 TaxID=3342640 RepID=UPI0035DEE61E